MITEAVSPNCLPYALVMRADLTYRNPFASEPESDRE
jgi:hypothetical protein